jgi:hypothetical protein
VATRWVTSRTQAGTSNSVVDGLTGDGGPVCRPGTRRSVVAVRCQHCGARYDTDLPVRAIERIRRCSRCGYPALVPVREGDEEPAEAAGEPDDR